MKIKVYRVEAYLASNELNGMIEVVSISKEAASNFAKRTFFRGSGWKITKVTEIRHWR